MTQKSLLPISWCVFRAPLPLPARVGARVLAARSPAAIAYRSICQGLALAVPLGNKRLWFMKAKDAVRYVRTWESRGAGQRLTLRRGFLSRGGSDSSQRAGCGCRQAKHYSAFRVALCFLSKSRFFHRAALNNAGVFQRGRIMLFSVAFVPRRVCSALTKRLFIRR